jgi:hypothetical protein
MKSYGQITNISMVWESKEEEDEIDAQFDLQ